MKITLKKSDIGDTGHTGGIIPISSEETQIGGTEERQSTGTKLAPMGNLPQR